MTTNGSFWILTPFNALFFLLLAGFVLLLVIASLAVRGKSRRTKKAVLVTACLITLAGFFAYKYALSLDAEYNVIQANMGGFNWWSELPLHLCNINMILIPVGVLLGSRALMGFSFFLGPLGAFMALVMPGSGFDGFPVFLPRMLGYFGTHFMIVIEGLALATFGLYRPAFRDLPRVIATIFTVGFVIHLINWLFRATGLNPKANYFYTMETEGNFLLDIFHRWIPLPFLYLIPCIAILAVYMGLVMPIFALTDRKAGRDASKGQVS